MKTNLLYVCLLISVAVSAVNGSTVSGTSATSCNVSNVTSTSPTGCFAHFEGTSAKADTFNEALQFGFLNLTTLASSDGPRGTAEAKGSINFTDQFLVDAGPGNGFVELTALWEGDAMASLPSFLSIAGVTSFLTPGAAGQLSILAPISFGRLYGISGEVSLQSGAGQCFGCARSDSKTLALQVQSIRVLNAAGTQLSDFRFRTDSTVEYGFIGGQFDPAAGVPEPSSMLLFGSSAVVIGLIRRRRAANSR